MKENKIVGQLYWGDTYVIIANDVIKLDVHADGDYRFESGNIIKKEALRRLINASSAESVDELLDLVKELNDIENWSELVKEMKHSISGKIVKGTWINVNKFSLNGNIIDVMPSSGVGGRLDKSNKSFPMECSVILINGTVFDGKDYKIIPWIF